MKSKIWKAIDAILDKDDEKARKLIQAALHEDKRYVAYRKQLSDIGLPFSEVLVEDNIYDGIKGILQKFEHKNLKLKILDQVYLEISKEKIDED